MNATESKAIQLAFQPKLYLVKEKMQRWAVRRRRGQSNVMSILMIQNITSSYILLSQTNFSPTSINQDISSSDNEF
jgi:hypothetical protein